MTHLGRCIGPAQVRRGHPQVGALVRGLALRVVRARGGMHHRRQRRRRDRLVRQLAQLAPMARRKGHVRDLPLELAERPIQHLREDELPGCEVVEQLVELRHDEFPHVHDVLHCRVVRPAELQDDLAKVGEGEVLLVLEDELREVHERDHVHAHLLQHLHGVDPQAEAVELVFAYQAVPMHVERRVVHHLYEPVLEEIHCHLLLLNRRHDTDHFDQHPHEHVHHGEGPHQYEEDEEHRVARVRGAHLLHHARLVGERPHQQERHHRVRHGLEVLLPYGCVHGDVPESDGEHVDDEQEQGQGERHRPRRAGEPFYEDEQIREGAQQAHQTGHPHEPDVPDYPEHEPPTEHATVLRREVEDGEDGVDEPCFEDHHDEEE
mmetsp:Transcript_44554/g.125999  ORF Transcript_44554/g.125999 Transcript_44554/m.125999 type:complete len:377 (-) Transcript_44554:151-1281(-)